MTTKPVVRPQGGGRQPRPLRDRFEERVDRSVGPDACWPWRGSLHGPAPHHNYGRISEGGRAGRSLYAHRVAYALANGPLPDDVEVMHSCDNPPCCNPRHLTIGTHASNMADMAAKGRVRKADTGPRGEKHWAAKLTTDSVREARAAHASGATLSSIARRLGVSVDSVQRAVRGRTWRAA